MKSSRIAVFAVLSCLVLSGCATQQKLAQTPPMGWNSFDSYGVYLHEKAAMENVEAMAEKLKPYGYEFFVVDNGWFRGMNCRGPAKQHSQQQGFHRFTFFGA